METRPSLLIYCVDVGSIENGNFAWARNPESKDGTIPEHYSIDPLVQSVVTDLNASLPVALGFECPLFVPVPADSRDLGKARLFEEDRPWSAGAGPAVLATGIAQTTWILIEIRQGLEARVPVYLDWPSFVKAGRGLLLWEAFISWRARRPPKSRRQNYEDARLGAKALRAGTSPGHMGQVGVSVRVHSLIGAAILRAGLSRSRELLAAPCTVVKVH